MSDKLWPPENLYPQGAAELAIAFEDEQRKRIEDMHRSIEASYGFLGNSEREKLQAQMAGIGGFASSIPELDPGYAAKQAAEQFAKSAAYPDPTDSAMREAALRAETQRLEARHHEALPIHSRPWIPPPIEDTPLGRAVLESAAHSEEVASKVESLVGLVAGLNRTLVMDVIPAWTDQVKRDQQTAKDSFDHAAKQLKWAIVAVFVSAVVAILATWWQIDVTREIDRENSEQQRRIEEIMREQLAKQQNLIDQQAQDAAAMRAAITAVKSTEKPVVPKK